MKNYSKEQVLKIMTSVSEKYEEKLKDKHFLIVYQENINIRTVQVGFRDFNYLHMTGVKSALSAPRFYEKCINKKLKTTEFELDVKGNAHRKLMVLPYLPDLLYNNCMIGDFINSGICIKADYFVGNTKAVLSVGFRTGKSVDFPVTLYNEDIRKLTQPTCKVLAIFRKEYKEKYYMKCTYLSKGQDINKLLLLEEVNKLIRVDDDIEVLDSNNEKVVPEVPPEPDEIRAIERANRSIAENGTIPHEAINWD
ncbi:MAG: hypothetical protein HDR03_01480 [Lachnospiraceae bacterium]|nr:hypothetical protein [Lachnospiraceae bacterium]